ARRPPPAARRPPTAARCPPPVARRPLPAIPSAVKNAAMPNYRRAFRPGGTFFLTLITERRAPLFAHDDARAMLRDAIEHCRTHHPFDLDASVLLPDHLHLLLTLPPGDADFSRRIG